MAKKLSILMIMAIIITFTSCGLGERFELDEELHNKIKSVWDEGEPSHIIYEGEKYKYVGTTNHFKVDSSTYEHYEDVMLSWNGKRHIGYIDCYYSDTADSPVFIYNARLPYVYFREDYDYLADTFVIDGTDAEITYENIYILDSEQVLPDFNSWFRVIVYSKEHSRIKVRMGLVNINDQWYIAFEPIVFGKRVKGCLPSDEFIEILLQNGIIHT